MKIVGVAVKDTEGNVHSLPKPNRHCDVIQYMGEEKQARFAFGDHNQGFVDEDGNFLSRQEARKIALKNGQCEETIRPDRLYSEDLW
jgi:hypothetical protein